MRCPRAPRVLSRARPRARASRPARRPSHLRPVGGLHALVGGGAPSLSAPGGHLLVHHHDARRVPRREHHPRHHLRPRRHRGSAAAGIHVRGHARRPHRSPAAHRPGPPPRRPCRRDSLQAAAELKTKFPSLAGARATAPRSSRAACRTPDAGRCPSRVPRVRLLHPPPLRRREGDCACAPAGPPVCAVREDRVLLQVARAGPPCPSRSCHRLAPASGRALGTCMRLPPRPAIVAGRQHPFLVARLNPGGNGAAFLVHLAHSEGGEIWSHHDVGGGWGMGRGGHRVPPALRMGCAGSVTARRRLIPRVRPNRPCPSPTTRGSAAISPYQIPARKYTPALPHVSLP